MNASIVVLISGSGTNMAALADACTSREVPGTVVAAVADRECPGLRLAEERDIPRHVLEPKSFDTREQWCDELRDLVASHDPALVVSAGFMRILSRGFVNSFTGKLINLHPSLLPAFRGAHAVRDALEAGVRVTGSTIHLVDAEVDHGPIVMQKPVPVREDDSVESLHERIKALEHRLLPEVCKLFLEGRVKLEGDRVHILER